MRLLVITQTVDINDPVMSFFHQWISLLSQRFERVEVICLGSGEYNLSSNVGVYSLGKEKNNTFINKIINFYKYLWRLNGEYDAVFVHMNEEYVLLAGSWWRLTGRRVGLWRNHKQGSWKTYTAVWLSNLVFCTSPFSFTKRFSKTLLMPVGIDTNMFTPISSENDQAEIGSILCLGRIAPVKKIDILIEALRILKGKGITFVCDIVGDCLPRDIDYLNLIKRNIKDYNLDGLVKFHPGVSNMETPGLYWRHKVFVNMTPSGSLDKTILESMACGSLPLMANKSMEDELDNLLIFNEDSAESLADHLIYILDMPKEQREKIIANNNEYVKKNHSLDLLIDKLFNILS